MNKLIIGLIAIVLLIILFFVWRQLTTSSENDAKSHSQSPNKTDDPKRETLLEIERAVEMNPEFYPKYTSDMFQAGMNVLVYGHPNMAEVDKLYTKLHELGINSIAIVFPFYQEDWRASNVKANPMITPTIKELQELIERAHEQGLSVMLRPILDEESIVKSNKWRGQIEPSNVDGWFESYRSLLLTYAELAQTTNVNIFNIGTEFNSLEQGNDKKWIQLIEAIRNVYDGKLIYSFNWDIVQTIIDLEFIKYLDYVGIDAYFPLDAPDGASTKTLKVEWKKWIHQMKELLNRESIIVTEVGTLPVKGSYRTPYSWTYPNMKMDLDAQVHYYESTFEIWKPISEGIYWWCVTIDADESVTYSPLNLPTERIIKKQLLHQNN